MPARPAPPHGPSDAPSGEDPPRDDEHEQEAQPVETQGMGPCEEHDAERAGDEVAGAFAPSGEEGTEALRADPEQREQAEPDGPKLAHASPMRPGAAYPGGTWPGKIRG